MNEGNQQEMIANVPVHTLESEYTQEELEQLAREKLLKEEAIKNAIAIENTKIHEEWVSWKNNPYTIKLINKLNEVRNAHIVGAEYGASSKDINIHEYLFEARTIRLIIDNYVSKPITKETSDKINKE